MTTARYSRYFTFIKPVIEHRIVRTTTPYIFSLVTIAIFAVFVIRPTIATILTLQKQISDNQQLYQSLKNKAENLTQGKENLDNLDPQVKLKIGSAVPQRPDVTFLISSLQNATRDTASISALQVQPITIFDFKLEQKKKAELGEVNFSMNTQGSYSQIIEVLNNLTKSPRLFSLSSVTINKQATSPIILSIAGKAYYLK